MEPLQPGDTLVSRIGDQSFHFFSALRTGHGWLSESAATWAEIPGYQTLENFAKNLPICNDATERMVKRVTDYADYGARPEADFQSTLIVAGKGIRNLPSSLTKKALIESHKARP